MALIVAITMIVLTLQSCSIPIHINQGQRYVSLNDIYAPVYIYGFALLIGNALSILVWVKMNRISKKLKELGHPI